MGRGHALGGGPRVRIAALVVLVLGLALPAVATAAPPTWLAAQDLAGGPSDSPPPQVATDAAGDATAVWQGVDGANLVIQAATRPAGGGWSAPARISTAGQNAFIH